MGSGNLFRGMTIAFGAMLVIPTIIIILLMLSMWLRALIGA